MEKAVKKTRVNLSVVVVSYKTDALAKKISLAFKDEKAWEVIVIRNDEDNVGYGAGCNRGVAQARGTFILFLNPDVRIDKPSIRRMMKYLQEHSRTGVVGPQYVKRDGSIEQTSTGLPTPATFAVSLSFIGKLLPGNAISKEYLMPFWDRTATRDVGAVSGAALLVRAKEFRALGGFDERFFLYWEEVDLCKRYLGSGYTVTFLAEAKTRHAGQASAGMEEQTKVRDIFERSRSHFMRKHFGFPVWTLLSLWFTLTEHWRLSAVLLVSAVLRTYEISRYIPFFGDMGRDYRKALEFLNGQAFPLLGIPSSVPRFVQGPFNIWFDALSFAIGGVSLGAPVLFAAMLTTFAAGLLYRLLDGRYGKRIALACALLFATSPAAVMHSRAPFYLFAVPLFTLFVLLAAANVRKSSSASVFVLVLSGFLLLQWEIAALPILGVVIYTVWKMRVHVIRQAIPIFAGVFLGLLPKLLYDVSHGCEQLCGLATWSVYRIVALTGFDGRHGISLQSIAGTVNQVGVQFSQLFGRDRYMILLLGAVVAYGAYVLVIRKKEDMLAESALVAGVFMLLGILVHGTPSEAYFPPFLVVIPVLVAFGVKHMQKNIGVIVGILLLVLSAKQAVGLFTHRFYARNVRDIIFASEFIAKDAEGQNVRLKSYDTGSEFPTYLDTYRFLLEIRGVKESEGGVLYVISNEDSAILPAINTDMHFFGHVTVVKQNVYNTLDE